MDRQTRSYSLRRRLLIWLLGPLCVIGALALADAYYSARQTANEVFDRVLTGSALAIGERVFVNEDSRLDVDIPYMALEMLTSAAHDRVFYRIDGPKGAFITGYKTLSLPDQNENPQRMTFLDSHFRGAPIRIAIFNSVASTGNNSISYRVAVAETTNARDALTGKIIIRTAIRLALLIFSAAIIVWFAVARSLIPLKRLEEAIGRRSSDDLRAIHHHVPKEVDGLVRTINSFMKRLDNALTALKHFSGNASHQIRTPLTIIKTQLALARRSGSLEEAVAAMKICDEAVSEAERTLSQLLLLARIDVEASKDLTSSKANLSEIARKVSEAYVIGAAEAGFDLGYESKQQIDCRGDPVLLRELLRNLIDNAIKHATNGKHITIRVKSETGSAILQVEDDGVGMSPGQRKQIMSGMAPAKQIGDRDTGLGLPIVFEIAKLFSGTVELRSGSGNSGLLVEVTLMLASPAT
ncbi:MAG: sensor histidine kinase [Hyphomicrobiales bacterium]|nr:sensor histidine kinase [Hyphomicrobiales bacterium]